MQNEGVSNCLIFSCNFVFFNYLYSGILFWGARAMPIFKNSLWTGDTWRNNIDIKPILFKPFLCTYILAKEITVCISNLQCKNSVETHISGTDGVLQDMTCYIMAQTSIPSFDRKKSIKNITFCSIFEKGSEKCKLQRNGDCCTRKIIYIFKCFFH